MTHPSSDIPASPLLRTLSFFAIILVAACIYGPRLNDFFLSDDFHYLRVYSESQTLGFTDEWYAVTVGELHFHFRPVFGFIGWLNYVLFGLEPFWWHLLSLALHILTVWLTVVLVRRFTTSEWAALGAGALFAVHFIHAESVVWISARTSLLSAVLVLGTITLETRSRAKTWGSARWGALLIALLALLAKEHAIALPLLLLLVPSEPLEMTGTGCNGMGARKWMRRLWERILHLWPYWALCAAFIAIRFGAVIASTQALFYRLEMQLNVLKNLVFVCVANLFPLDFRAALAAWNKWYLRGDTDAMLEFVLGYPEVIVGTVAALIIWLSILLWSRPAARRLAAWVFVAALPVLFFRGTGERLMYLGGAGTAGAVAVILTSWHRSFLVAFRRAGRWVCPILFIIFIIVNIRWLNSRLRDWDSASELSQTIVSALVDHAGEIPPGAGVTFTGLPDNINGAWVFRLGIGDAFRLYAGRPDVRVVRRSESEFGQADTETLTSQWNGERFVLRRTAKPDERKAPQ